MIDPVFVSYREYCLLVADARRYRWLRSEGLHHIRWEGLTTDTCDVGLDWAIDSERFAGESEEVSG